MSNTTQSFEEILELVWNDGAEAVAGSGTVPTMSISEALAAHNKAIAEAEIALIDRLLRGAADNEQIFGKRYVSGYDLESTRESVLSSAKEQQ